MRRGNRNQGGVSADQTRGRELSFSNGAALGQSPAAHGWRIRCLVHLRYDGAEVQWTPDARIGTPELRRPAGHVCAYDVCGHAASGAVGRARLLDVNPSTRGEAAIPESTRWIDGYERIAKMAAQLPATRLVLVADREVDFGALLGRAQTVNYPADLLIRARYDRKLQADDTQLFAALSQAPALGEVVSALTPGRGKKARAVTQSVSVVPSVMRLPSNQTTTLTVVQAMEHHSPQGDKPVLALADESVGQRSGTGK
ncbi:hypothetical protein SAMN06295970_13029 [Noviherbaspirillum suwonense]|uniref:Transposase IS4-like domain-containing protein n=1 Tax=Noviherbaspirillum suwonense TaxID=1224511 RepID=A0ABY1QU00_9BURK|nr:hypothetical protein SAMN06295970_13029 [Noviherbaspirillum suwonense]